MRKLLALGLVLFAVSFVFDGCKKGPEDPFFSFRSRKKRIEGHWKVVKYLHNNIDSTQLVMNYTFDNVGDPCGQIDVTSTRDWIIRFRFDEDGRYEKDSVLNWRYAIGWENESETNTNPFAFNAPNLGIVSGTRPCVDWDSLWVDTKVITKGFWMWAGGTNDIKNKERLFLTDGEDQFDGISYDIIELRDKEMKLVFAVSDLTTGQVNKIQYNMEATDPFGEGD